jgi:uroporphyrinogen decarboxylase
VDVGIDILNPIETAAGMDIAEMHRRYPRLVFSGGIDVSNLLPFGTPQEVRDATVKAIEDSDGQILVGSSTELQYAVPLENFLAMRQAVLDYKV